MLKFSHDTHVFIFGYDSSIYEDAARIFVLLLVLVQIFLFRKDNDWAGFVCKSTIQDGWIKRTASDQINVLKAIDFRPHISVLIDGVVSQNDNWKPSTTEVFAP